MINDELRYEQHAHTHTFNKTHFTYGSQICCNCCWVRFIEIIEIESSFQSMNETHSNETVQCANVKSFVKLFVLPNEPNVLSLICSLDFLLILLSLFRIRRSAYNFTRLQCGFSLAVMGIWQFYTCILNGLKMSSIMMQLNWCEL